MLLIGVNGFKRSGKGEVSRIIAEAVPGVVQVGFADKLKILAARAIGLPEDKAIEEMDWLKEKGEFEVWDSSAHDWSPREITGRQYLQNIGQGARELFGDTFWIDMVLPNPKLQAGWVGSTDLLADAYPGVEGVVITDLRYENEAKRVKALGGQVWEVTRPGRTSDGHASEQPLPRSLVDRTFNNDGSLEALELQVRRALL